MREKRINATAAICSDGVLATELITETVNGDCLMISQRHPYSDDAAIQWHEFTFSADYG